MEFFLNSILRRSPMFLMAVSGIIIGLVRWKRHTKVSLLTLIALGLSLAQGLVSMIVFYVISDRLGSDIVLYLLQDFFQMITIILLVTAALSQRNASAPQS